MHLSIVRQTENQHREPNRLIVVNPSGARRVATYATRAIPVPLISLLLGDWCRLGPMIDTGTEYGLQVSAQLDVVAQGTRMRLVGALVPLVGGPDLVLPPGCLERHQL